MESRRLRPSGAIVILCALAVIDVQSALGSRKRLLPKDCLLIVPRRGRRSAFARALVVKAGVCRCLSQISKTSHGEPTTRQALWIRRDAVAQAGSGSDPRANRSGPLSSFQGYGFPTGIPTSSKGGEDLPYGRLPRSSMISYGAMVSRGPSTRHTVIRATGFGSASSGSTSLFGPAWDSEPGR